MKPPPLLQEAVAKLCKRFEAGGYALTPVIDIGALVANADGTVDDNELEMLHYLFEALLGLQLNKELLSHLVRSSIQLILEAGLEPRTRFIAQILMDCHAVEEGLTVALAVAYASDGLEEPERNVVLQIARAARYAPAKVDALAEKVKAAMGVAS